MSPNRLRIITAALGGGAGRVSALLASTLKSRDIETELIYQSRFGVRRPQNFREFLRLAPVAFLSAIDILIVKKPFWPSHFSLFRDLWTGALPKPSSVQDYALMRWGPGFVSPKALDRKGYKKIIWSVPDEFAFTGGCHLSLGCNEFKAGCMSCPAVRPGFKMLVRWNYSRKLTALQSLGAELTYVFPSQGMKDKFAGTPLGQAARRSVVIAHPLDLDFTHRGSTLEVRERFKKNKPIRFIMVAEHLDDPIKAVAEAVSVIGAIPDYASLTLVGSASSRLRRKGAGRRNISFTGKLEGDSLVSAIRQSDIFLVASEGEFFGSAALQALSQSVPVLAHADSGAASMCHDLGVLFTFKDLRQLGRMIDEGFLSRAAEISEYLTKVDWRARSKSSTHAYQTLIS